MHPVRAVIFDMDGTLADSIEHYYALARDVAARAGAPPPPRERVCELMGRGDPDLLRKLLPDDFPDATATLRRVVAELIPRWLRAAERIEPLPGVVDLIERLGDRGLRLGIATSSGRALPYLDRWGVRERFHAIVGREDVARRKPHPECVLCCLERLGVEAAEAMYVGDSPIDVEAGRAAGLRTVAVLTGTSDRAALHAREPDFILPSAAGLADVLLR